MGLRVTHPRRGRSFVTTLAQVRRLEDRIVPANSPGAVDLITQIENELANAPGSDGVITPIGAATFTDRYLATNNAMPRITQNLTIAYADYDSNLSGSISLQIEGGGFRFFEIASGATLTLKGINLRGGNGLAIGGAIKVNEGGRLILEECTLSDNQVSGEGGAIYAEGTVELYRSFFGNETQNNPAEANNAGTGSALWTNFSATIENCTFDGNTGTSTIFSESRQITFGNQTQLVWFPIVVRYSTFNNNPGLSLAGFGQNFNVVNSIFELTGIQDACLGSLNFCFIPQSVTPPTGAQGNIVASGGNDADLNPLEKNGGRTLSHSLKDTSPVIDVGDFQPTLFSWDQREAPRAVDGDGDGDIVPDMGSIEFQQPIDRLTDTSPWVQIFDNAQVVNPTQTLQYVIHVRNLNPFPVNFGRVDITFNHLIRPIKGNLFDPNVDENFASREITEVTWWTELEGGARGTRSGTGSIHEIVSMEANTVMIYRVTVNVPYERLATVLLQSTDTVPRTVNYRVGFGPVNAAGQRIGGYFGDAIIAKATLRGFDTISGTATGSTTWRDENELQAVNQNVLLNQADQIQAPVEYSQSNPYRTPILRYQTVDASQQFLLARPVIAVGSAPGQRASVVAMDAASGDIRYKWFPFGDFTGGVHVTTADVVGHYVYDNQGRIMLDPATGKPLHDGTLDVIVAANTGGGPHVKIYDGRTGFLYREFFAYAPTFTGGVWVAAGDFQLEADYRGHPLRVQVGPNFVMPASVILNDNAGRAEVVTGAGPGGAPLVRVWQIPQAFSGRPTSVRDFYAYTTSFRGGVTVADGDVNGDGVTDVVTGAGPGGGPHVKIFSGVNNALISEFYAYSNGFRGGVNVAAGDVNNDGFAEVVTSPMSSGGPHVKVYSVLFGGLIGQFFAGDYFVTTGVSTQIVDRDRDGTNDIVTALGRGVPVRARAFRPNGTLVNAPALIPFEASNLNGAYVG